MKVIHFIHSHWGVLGGVQSVLNAHAAHDLDWGIESRCFAFCDHRSSDPFFVPIGLHGRESLHHLRQRIAERIAAERPRIVIWHGLCGIGLGLLAPESGVKGIGYLHVDSPGLEAELQAKRHALDGLLCVSEALQRRARAILPEIDPWRIEAIRYPIDRPPAREWTPASDGALRLGYVGRLTIEQKRVDRIPEFLPRLGELPFSFHIIGDGAEWLHLRIDCAAWPTVSFSGRILGGAYWHALQALDAIVFFSEYEGTPLALLEALACGVLPIYPRIGSGADALVAAIDERFLYPPGDLDAAAEAARMIAALAPKERAVLRDKARDAVAPYALENYGEAFSGFLHRIETAPKVSTALPVSWLWDHMLIGVTSRLQPRYLQAAV